MASTLYAAKLTTVRAGAIAAGNYGGICQRLFDTYTVPAATIAAGDTLLFGIWLPKGCRMLGGVWKNTAGGAAATGKIGSYNATTLAVIDDDHWGTLTDMTAATSQTFGDTNAKCYGEVLTSNQLIGVLTAANAIQAAAVITMEVAIAL